jgi:roadblock/LC7 domain-containing protein
VSDSLTVEEIGMQFEPLTGHAACHDYAVIVNGTLSLSIDNSQRCLFLSAVL